MKHGKIKRNKRYVKFPKDRSIKSKAHSLAAADILSKIKGRNIKIIGLGGIGATLVSYMARFLWSRNARTSNVTLYLADGDKYEFKNSERMAFSTSEMNKAVVKAMEMADAFTDKLLVIPIPFYVDPQNIKDIICDKDIVLLAVDNHRTRKLVSDHCGKLRDILLISGGNDGVENGYSGAEGNIQIYERRGGKNLKNPITLFHPEIQYPDDEAPSNKVNHCDQLANGSAPQVLFTNLAVASAMLNAFYSWLHDCLDYEEAYLDILTGKVHPSYRELFRNKASKNKSV